MAPDIRLSGGRRNLELRVKTLGARLGGVLLAVSLRRPHVLRHSPRHDSCIGNDKVRPTRPEWNLKRDENFMRALAASGFSVGDIDFVMCTHLHVDHVGWRSLDTDFPKAQKAPGSQVAGRATVFIFPDLNTGNITYKAVQRSAHVMSVGPMLQGLRKPVNDLSRGALVDDIVYTIALTAIQAEQSSKARLPINAK